jgi:hypothetical protein
MKRSAKFVDSPVQKKAPSPEDDDVLCRTSLRRIITSLILFSVSFSARRKTQFVFSTEAHVAVASAHLEDASLLLAFRRRRSVDDRVRVAFVVSVAAFEHDLIAVRQLLLFSFHEFVVLISEK